MFDNSNISYSKLVKGATKLKMAPPKAKYVDPILNDMTNAKHFNSIVHSLQDRLSINNWIIVFKSLVVIHLMINTNDSALSYFSTHLHSFQINNILHSNKWSPNDSIVLRRYNDYLKGKCLAFREVTEFNDSISGSINQIDFQEKKLIEVESMESQIKDLIKNKFSLQDLQNDLIFYAFKILIKDLLQLYNQLNEGIITLLESFFDLNYEFAERTLNLYKSFVKLTDYVVKYLKIGKATGLNIPVIKHITTKLIESLEDHLHDKTNFKNTKSKNNNNTMEKKSQSTHQNNTNSRHDTVKSSAEERLQKIREQKQKLEQQLQQKQQLIITPTLPQSTGTNPFLTYSPQVQDTTGNINGNNVSMEAQLTSNPFVQDLNTGHSIGRNSTGYYAQNRTVIPSYTGTGFGGYSQQPQQANTFTTVTQQQPLDAQYTNNPFVLQSISEESVEPSQVAAQQQQYAQQQHLQQQQLQQQQLQQQHLQQQQLTQEQIIQQSATGVAFVPVQIAYIPTQHTNPFEPQPQHNQGLQQNTNSNLIEL